MKALPLLRPIPSGAVAWVGAALLLAASGFAALPVKAQVKEAPPAASVPASVPAAKQVASKPLWRDLTARQQRALAPLAPHWDGLTEPHKRKWLALSRNYAALPPADQEILHSRMIEWAALSNHQRTQARFNFAEVKQVPVDERKAKWEAYQALSEEEKRKLAERATPRPGAAATFRPVPPQKLAPFPAVAPDGQHTPRIQLAPSTPLPVRPQLVAPAPAPAAAPAFPPVSAEAQIPPPSSTPSAETSASAAPPVRATEQPSSAP
ncbi:DUF3106 domain-containing protein [Variovorax sp. LjRoot84]|uniref:DUF3106 domain-containing protein n=1 Tax=Variovorax sp. LjRoot84 TaxID=3342340 RepID=UPI003ECEBC5A